ncbi:MAG: recombinase family protein [Vulcanimicrobiaceae bacterium]
MKYFIYCRKSTESEDRQVLSIDSQFKELQQKFTDPSIEIVNIYRESFSAKAPGRPIFDEMISNIEQGQAEGIIAWHPDRLARNSVDGGRIIHLLDRNLLKDLRFATLSFENNSQGKFMLQIIFGYSKYYVDSLSENVKRGMRAKIERGWFPARPPIGYENDRNSNTIIRDPEHFEIVKRLLDLALTGSYTAMELCQVARTEWHYMTPKSKRMGGRPLGVSTTYRILENPFYAGYFYWNRIMHKGQHESMITLEEHERIQRVILRRAIKRPSRNTFPYTGLMRCGECGLSITAEKHTNRFGSRYVYYRCTKKRIVGCTQPFLEAHALEAQFVAFLQETTISPTFEDWIIQEGLPAETSSLITAADARASLTRSITELRQQLSNLIDLRLRDQIGEEDFVTRRRQLDLQVKAAEDQLEKTTDDQFWLEPLASMISFNKCAVSWLLRGDEETKRIIIKTVGSNPRLLDKKVSIGRAKPFAPLSESDTFSDWRARLREVRRLIVERDPETMTALQSIKMLVVRKGLVLPPLGLSHLPEPLSQKEAEGEETSGIG